MKGTDKLTGIVFLCKHPRGDSWGIRWGGGAGGFEQGINQGQ